MLLILQTTWSCYCNHLTKHLTWRACNADFERDLKPNFNYWKNTIVLPVTFEYFAVQLQLFEHIFIDSYDLPREFKFPHYFNLSVNAHTVDMVHVSTGSYAVLMAVIVLSQSVVRCGFHGCLGLDYITYIFFGFGCFLLLCFLILFVVRVGARDQAEVPHHSPLTTCSHCNRVACVTT